MCTYKKIECNYCLTENLINGEVNKYKCSKCLRENTLPINPLTKEKISPETLRNAEYRCRLTELDLQI